jgi:hypothetical protein
LIDAATTDEAHKALLDYNPKLGQALEELREAEAQSDG